MKPPCTYSSPKAFKQAFEQLQTNRDLYLFVTECAQRHSATSRSLEQYLTVLWRLGCAHRTANAISLSCFAMLLEKSFTDAIPVESAWLQVSQGGPLDGFQKWERQITSQVVDLRKMREVGTLANELRYFGMSAPSGSYWYNFDPLTFLECATEGAFGGWQPDDDTGRAYVPGEVAALDSEGKVVCVAPQEIDNPIYELAEISWEQFIKFLWAGQCYE
jgi:hypothetical protein